jgi:molecular chaperone DnaK (HSP70)
MVYAYGIDLGTTYSCIAKANEKGEVEILRNSEGKETTPSVVEFESPTKVAVGETAKESAIINSAKVVQYIKRSMGKTDFRYTQQGVNFTPEEISAYILKKLVADAKAAGNEEIKDVVITVPAYFGLNERTATENAGKIAGLNVLALVNEPSAAAIAYNKKSENNGDKIVLVYDLGGGTFDITVAEIIGNRVEVICSTGDPNLGGKDWDADLAKYVITEFCTMTGATKDDVLDDSEFYNELMLKVENAKHILSSKDSTKIALSMGDKKAKIEITLEEFNKRTRGRLLNTIELTKNVIKTAATKTGSKGQQCDKFDEIILVGGSTKMRQVKAEIKNVFDKEPIEFEPDLAVAKGAALLAQYIISDPNYKREQTGKTLKGVSHISDVTNKSYGMEADVDEKTLICNIILKNEKVPYSNTDIFSTKYKNQRGASLVIYESESEKSECELSFGRKIAESSLELPPGLDAGSKIEVTFTIDTSGVLTVAAVEKTSGNRCEVKTETSGLKDDNVTQLQKKMKSMRIGDST